MTVLRGMVNEETSYWSDDQFCHVIPVDGDFLILGVYKHRGKTEAAYILSETTMKALTLEKANDIISGGGYRCL